MSLVLIMKDTSGLKIIFDDHNLQNIFLPKISTTPEIFFESNTSIIFILGRSFIEYHIDSKNINVYENQENILFYWLSNRIEISYKIDRTTIIVNNKDDFVFYGDVFKIISYNADLYFISDSVNSEINIYKLNSENIFSIVYVNKENEYLINFKECSHSNLCPLLTIYPRADLNKVDLSTIAIFFIHGGPHQKSGNVWDSLIATLLNEGYLVYIPQYTGTVGFKSKQYLNDYGIDDFKDVLSQYLQIKRHHKRVIILGHSYGAFLGLKLSCHSSVDIF